MSAFRSLLPIILFSLSVPACDDDDDGGNDSNGNDSANDDSNNDGANNDDAANNDDDSNNEVDNVAACEDFINAIDCGSVDLSQSLPCANFEQYTCDLVDYFDCLSDKFTCADGVPNTAGWADCVNLATCQ